MFLPGPPVNTKSDSSWPCLLCAFEVGIYFIWPSGLSYVPKCEASNDCQREKEEKATKVANSS